MIILAFNFDAKTSRKLIARTVIWLSRLVVIVIVIRHECTIWSVAIHSSSGSCIVWHIIHIVHIVHVVHVVHIIVRGHVFRVIKMTWLAGHERPALRSKFAWFFASKVRLIC